MIVVDASVLANALVDDQDAGRRARKLLSTDELVAPELIDVELLSVLRKSVRNGSVTSRRADQAVAELRALPLRRVPHGRLVERCWQLRNNVTPYDAIYVALAESLGATLVTADAKLAAAPGTNCAIELVS